ncbi:chlorite dismutase family protein [Candidatus Nitronereus thalassa]|uniref:Chlorite dismutase family protein n=1 Tax=Candidatus Nitronereus thalassa TaxID=3020898 RepID=A0ABU3KBL5_9BACT|nr:chlorite dismutase family protein [Candidatus Nitronereus thalassa]MDT7043807.1 chlorite dismutase family protein [Candidatus Nitronereus thalassa]
MHIFRVMLMSFLVFLVGNPALTLAAGSQVHGTFALFKVNPTWTRLSIEEKAKGVQEATAVVESFKDQITLDSYWTYGLTTDSHFLIRLQSSEAKINQELLTKLAGSGLGQHLDLEFTISGITKGLNYAPEFPDLLAQLKAAKYEGDPSTYVIMIPTRKSAEWWNLPKEERVALIREHTVPTLPYLKTVKRKLYHATGLADADFITIFETNNLEDFNNLVLALRMVKEDQYNVRLGSPTVLGTLKSWNEVGALLSK